MSSIKCIAFDLDDTLLDTSHTLVPAASQKACQAMIDLGLECKLQECMDLRQSLAESLSHTEIFPEIANRYPCKDPKSAVEAALRHFYSPEVPSFMNPMPGVIENLEYLKGKYKLFIVTMGEEETQKKKIAALRISHYFEKIYIVNGFKGHKKQTAFENIVLENNIKNSELLSIGNRISSEIHDANVIGAKTCFFAFGEHKNEKRLSSFDNPHYTVKNHRELLSTCEL